MTTDEAPTSAHEVLRSNLEHMLGISDADLTDRELLTILRKLIAPDNFEVQAKVHRDRAGSNRGWVHVTTGDRSVISGPAARIKALGVRLIEEAGRADNLAIAAAKGERGGAG